MPNIPSDISALTGAGAIPQPAPINPTQPPPPPAANPSPWRAILQGALFGLAGVPERGNVSFGAGMAGGARAAVAGEQQQFENQQRAAENASNIKFRNAQAADMLVEAKLHQQQLDNLPQEQQDAHTEANVATLEHLKNAFPGLQVTATNNDPASITAAMGSATATQGGVPAAIHLNVGKQVFSIPLDQEAITNSGGASLGLVNDMLKKQGTQPVSSGTWASMDVTKRNQLLDQAVHFGNPLPSQENLAAYKNYLTTAETNKDASAVAYLQPIVNKLQAGVDTINAQKQQEKQAEAASTKAGELAAETSPAAITAQAKLAGAKGQAEEQGRMAALNAPQGPGGLSLVDEIGQGKMVPGRLAYLLARNPTLMQAVAAKYPDFDSSKVESYQKTYEDFTSGKTSVALNSGATALKHMLELRALNTLDSRVPGTAAHGAFENKLNTVASELVRFYGMPSTNDSENALKKTMGGLGNRDAAILSQAQSMADKLASYDQTWKNAAPSSAYQAPLPQIDNEAKAALAQLAPQFTATHPEFALGGGKNGSPNLPPGATHTVPGPDGKLHYTNDQGTVDYGVVQQ